jgi:hypothetical protein
MGGTEKRPGVTLITLSKGAAHGLRRQMKGRVLGKTVTVKSVDRFAATAEVGLPKSRVVGKKLKVTFMVPVK